MSPYATPQRIGTVAVLALMRGVRVDNITRGDILACGRILRFGFDASFPFLVNLA